MKDFIISIRMYLFWTIALGLIYPLATTVLANAVFPKQANGGIIFRGSQAIGARLIAQKTESPRYFQPRPSSVDFNPLPSGGSNLGPTSADLLKAVNERLAKLRAANPDSGEPPQELLFASASGLDPHISPSAAAYQVKRVAKARGMIEHEVMAQVELATEGRQFGFLGEPTVNVLALNLALDARQGASSP